MTRIVQRAATALLMVASALLTGCDTSRAFMRPYAKSHGGPPAAEAQTAESADQDHVLDVGSPTTKSFFKPTRLTGGMSDEARDIERNLGIH